jgi:hypothetical protein
MSLVYWVLQTRACFTARRHDAHGLSGGLMTDAEVIAVIRVTHTWSNIKDPLFVRHYWDKATLDPGGTIFGPGPYVHLPVDYIANRQTGETERLVIRVYPSERVRRTLERLWVSTASGEVQAAPSVESSTD